MGSKIFAAESKEHKHWELWPYCNTEKTWHSLWCRWDCNAKLIAKFKAERKFKQDGKGGCTQNNIYYFEDERGTVKEGPLCGPWHISEEQSTPQGLMHPSREGVTILMTPKSAVWASMNFEDDSATGFELFLHIGGDLRMSAGVIYNPGGSLRSVALIREDSQDSFPSAFWTDSLEAKFAHFVEVQMLMYPELLEKGVLASGYVTHSDLTQEVVKSIDIKNTCLGPPSKGSGGPEMRYLICAENSVIIAFPKQRCKESFCCAVAWRVKGLLQINEVYYKNNSLHQTRYLRFAMSKERKPSVHHTFSTKFCCVPQIDYTDTM